MIWVIGDIHGMFDPLKRLLSYIQGSSSGRHSESRIEKIIFLGDYIDHGPSSKEVVDYIMGLPFPTVCLMGNHEDLMLQFLHRSDMFQSFGNVWFRGNGGQSTVSSFFPDILYGSDEERMPREEFPLDDRYLQFFNTLKFSHTEQICGVRFVFVHAMPNSRFPFQDQLDVGSFQDFHEWCTRNNVWIEDTLLWNRKRLEKRHGNCIFVHGHTPTTKLDRIWLSTHGYDPASGEPFFNFEAAEGESAECHSRPHELAFADSMNKLISINIDTGAVYGDRLTALGLSEELLAKNEFLVHQVLVNKGYRNLTEFYTIRVRLDV